MITGKEFAEKNFSQAEEKLFSTGNEELDCLLTEVYYSGIEDGYDYAQKEFAKKDSSAKKYLDTDYEESSKEERKKRSEKRKGRKLEDSHRGLGRSLILGGVIPGAIGAYTTKQQAEDDFREGYSEDEIVKRAGIRGAKRGAIAGGALGVAGGLASRNIGMAALSGAGGAAWGALGAHLGAKKNARVRLEKSKKNND